MLGNEHGQFDQRIVDAAAEWYARTAAEDASTADWSELRAWLNQDTEHRRAFEAMQDMSRSLQVLGTDERLRAVHDTAFSGGDEQVRSIGDRRTKWSASRQLALAASVLAALIIPTLYYMGSEDAPETSYLETGVGERQTFELADGSSMALSAVSRVTFIVSAGQRQLELHRGELFVEVAPDADKPFSVEAGSHVVTVTGTAFGVRYRRGTAAVTVHEGTVRVAPTVADTGIGDAQELQEGQRLLLREGETPALLGAEELQRAADWRNGWLHFENATLGELVNELEPYVDKQIILTSNASAQLLVGGSFNVDRIDVLWSTLETVVPVKVTEENDRILISERR